MTTIQTLLNRIKTAVYGKDVRSSIHDAIDQCYKDATGNPDSVAAIVNDLNETNENLRRVEAERENTHEVLVNHKNDSSAHFGGIGTETSGQYEKAIGTYNVSKASMLFSVGNGRDEGTRSNAMAVYNDGKVEAKRMVASSFELPDGTIIPTNSTGNGANPFNLYYTKFAAYSPGTYIKPGLTVFRVSNTLESDRYESSFIVDTTLIVSRVAAYSPLFTIANTFCRLKFTTNATSEIQITVEEYNKSSGIFTQRGSTDVDYFIICEGPVG